MAAMLACAWAPARAADLIEFWNQPRHGGNSFNRIPPDRAYYDALHGYGASWVRLSYEKWTPARRDFLIGDADQYQGLEAKDLAQLKASLDQAQAAGLKVVIAPLSLPGARWKQKNDGRFDDRLWQDKDYWKQAAAFWRDLARELKDHPAVAAYNLVNEPAPEFKTALSEHADAKAMLDWYQGARGSARDLPLFYAQLISAVREVDAKTPIMLDSGWYGAADAFVYWPKPMDDARVLYSFHMYEPYAATSAPNIKRAKPYPYPGKVPFGAGEQVWDGKRVAEYLQLPLQWAKTHGVPRERMVAGEFGCMRLLPGCKAYLNDVLSVLDKHQLHWAFYSFREDNWDGMDYELGSAKVPWAYWQAIDENKPDPVKRKPTPEFEPILRRLRSPEK
ncbi:glycoside hydrolase family 5 protein [Pseudomonas sp. CGJS7]|uniref:glycoside hydrolase family 5 protein n=1 Tax=Pseudomonas sp. CGJS7 TaxID=3109348 RepID=UPI003008ABD8